jgi:xylan 1,4-beta-xylosidase
MTAPPDPQRFVVDLSAAPLPLRQPWQWCVGSDHATTALRADWQAQLAQAHRDLGFRHVRFHGILDDAMGTLVMQGDQLLYSFFNTDRIFDFVLSIGMKPLVELSFMPRALASGNASVFRYQANITPPHDLAQWGELVRRLAAHWVERYGLDEVATWPFEVWNEPNLGRFWSGDQAAYFALYDTTAQALKAVDVRLQVGGPASAANVWLGDFVAHCAAGGVACDFISTHYYPTDAFGRVDRDTATQLEHAPRDIMRSQALAPRAATPTGMPLYYTEWNISAQPNDPLHDGAFAAALAVRIAMSVDDVVDGYAWWTFSDIFEEDYFASVPFHGGFGLLNLYGVPKPVYRGFEMMRALGDRRFAVAGEHPTVDVWAGRGAAPAADADAVLLVNQAMPRQPIGTASIEVALDHDPARRVAAARLERIDAAHANPERAWRELGAPEHLQPADVERLMVASRVVAEPVALRRVEARTSIDVVLAPQSVNLLRLSWEAMA